MEERVTERRARRASRVLRLRVWCRLVVERETGRMPTPVDEVEVEEREVERSVVLKDGEEEEPARCEVEEEEEGADKPAAGAEEIADAGDAVEGSRETM